MPLSVNKIRSYLTKKQSKIFFFLVSFLEISMLVSPFTTGLGYFLFGFLLLFTGFAKLREFVSDKKSLWLSLFYFIHVLGLLWTHDFSFAANDLRIKIAWILFPLAFFTFGGITYKQWRIMLWLFTATILVAFFFSLNQYLQNPKADHRQYSVFISHIRFSLILTASLYFHGIEFFRQRNKKIKLLHLLSIAFLIVYLLFISALSGIIIAIILVPLFLSKQLKKSKQIIIFSLIFLLIPLTYIIKVADDFFPDESFAQQCKKNGLKGNENLFLRLHLVENGHFVGIDLNMPELKQTWERKYERHYPLENQPNFYTLLSRYLTSKSLPKNALGVNSLNKQDFKNLQNGLANYIFSKKSALYKRTYKLISGIFLYYYGNNPSGHTFTQRLEYWKAGWHILQKNYLTGVGEGDIKEAFSEQYKTDKTQLFPNFRFRTHNQFLSFYISFGIFGGTLCLLALIIPYFLTKRKNIYFSILFTIMLLSMLTEDTFETQAGSTFFAFFYSLFLYSPEWRKTDSA